MNSSCINFSSYNKLNKVKASPKYELPFVKIALGGRKGETTHILNKVKNSKCLISDQLDQLLFTGFEGTLNDFYKVYHKKKTLKNRKNKTKIKLNNRLLIKSDKFLMPLKLTKTKEFNFMNKSKDNTLFNIYTNKNANSSLERNKDNSRNKSAFEINAKNISNYNIDNKTNLFKTKLNINKNFIMNKEREQYQKIQKIKNIRKILNKKSKDILASINDNLQQSTIPENQSFEDNNIPNRKTNLKKINILKSALENTTENKNNQNNISNSINETFKKYLQIRNNQDDIEELKKILDPLGNGYNCDLKEISKYDGIKKQNIWMKRSTANLVSFGHSFLIMADDNFYKEHKRIIGIYPGLEKEANILVPLDKTKGDDKIINKMEQNERKIRFIINDTDSLMKTIKSKTIKPSKSYTTIHKNKIKFFK